MAEQHTFHGTVLREYDVRGIVGDTLTEDDARALGRSFGSIAIREQGAKRICVGYDGRHSSPGFAQAVAEGLAACGLEVMKIEMGPTPMLYFSVYHLEADGGIMVTGSHNPPDYNGFKMMIGKLSFFGQDIQRLGQVAAAGEWESGEGSITEVSVEEAYLDKLTSAYTAGDKGLTVAWDAGNGVTGDVMKKLTARLPGKHVLLFEDIDGDFPNHHPDPTVAKNLVDLQNAVTENGCDLGIGFDGDGDRIGCVDGQARILWGDQLLSVLARDVLKKHPGATIIADVKTSQAVFDTIAKLGGQPLMWKTGHSLLKAKIAETGAPLAGEMSGHVFFKDGYYGFDDAIFAAVRLVNYLAQSGETLGELRDALPKTLSTPELRFDCPEERKFDAVAEICARMKEAGAEVNDIDGARVKDADGWWLVRASNTQPVLVARVEAETEETLERLKGQLADQLRASNLEVPEGL